MGQLRSLNMAPNSGWSLLAEIVGTANVQVGIRSNLNSERSRPVIIVGCKLKLRQLRHLLSELRHDCGLELLDSTHRCDKSIL